MSGLMAPNRHVFYADRVVNVDDKFPKYDTWPSAAAKPKAKAK